MKVTVTFRHMPPSDALREHAASKLRHVISKYFQEGVADAHVVLSVERYWHIADVNVSLQGLTVVVEERSENMYNSIDLAISKVERQVGRHKDKLREHKGARVAMQALGE